MIRFARLRSGFTLIELLIVVAIIAILAAIAVPNFLQAQIRAKIAKVEGDFYSVAVAMESYYTDYQEYVRAVPGAYFEELRPLTTPVKYMANIPLDPFKPWDICPRDRDRDGRCVAQGSAAAYLNDGGGYNMVRYHPNSIGRDVHNLWTMHGLGPDADEERNYYLPVWNEALRQWFIANTYDVSNGLISSGDMHRFGPFDPRVLK